MTAEPLLNKVAKTLTEHHLEAVMVGNAAAALHGAPVTTLDIDFMFRKTAANLKKLKGVARSLGSVVFKQYFPSCDIYQLVNDDRGFQVVFFAHSNRIESLEASDFPAEYEARTCIATVRQEIPTIYELSEELSSSAQEDALKKESERALIDQICRLLALPMNKRTNFLRVRRPGGGSHL